MVWGLKVKDSRMSAYTWTADIKPGLRPFPHPSPLHYPCRVWGVLQIMFKGLCFSVFTASKQATVLALKIASAFTV